MCSNLLFVYILRVICITILSRDRFVILKEATIGYAVFLNVHLKSQ